MKIWFSTGPEFPLCFFCFVFEFASWFDVGENLWASLTADNWRGLSPAAGQLLLKLSPTSRSDCQTVGLCQLFQNLDLPASMKGDPFPLGGCSHPLLTPIVASHPHLSLTLQSIPNITK